MCGLSEHGRLGLGGGRGVGEKCRRGSMTLILPLPLPLPLLLLSSLEEDSCWEFGLTDHVLPLSDKHFCTPFLVESCVKARRERNM